VADVFDEGLEDLYLPAKLGPGFFDQTAEGCNTFPDQLVVLSGYAHGAALTDDPMAHVSMSVSMKGCEYIVRDLGYNTETQTLRYSLRRVGGMQTYFLALQHDEETQQNNFIPPTTEVAINLMLDLMADGNWHIAI
jgi:hypothetical protein